VQKKREGPQLLIHTFTAPRQLSQAALISSGVRGVGVGVDAAVDVGLGGQVVISLQSLQCLSECFVRQLHMSTQLSSNGSHFSKHLPSSTRHIAQLSTAVAVGVGVGDGVAEDWRDCAVAELSDSSDVVDSWVELRIELSSGLDVVELVVVTRLLIVKEPCLVEESVVAKKVLALIEEGDGEPEELNNLVNVANRDRDYHTWQM